MAANPPWALQKRGGQQRPEFPSTHSSNAIQKGEKVENISIYIQDIRISQNVYTIHAFKKNKQ